MELTREEATVLHELTGIAHLLRSLPTGEWGELSGTPSPLSTRHGARGAPGGGRRSSNGGGECRERRRRSPGAPQHLKNHRSEAAGPARGRAHPTLAWVVATRPRVPSLPPKKKKGKGFRVRGTTITGAARRCASSGAGWRACSSACSTHQPPHITIQHHGQWSGR
ncbi:uncharacterized protein ACA1_053840 [Acanthamoeba castellanii str. Neff]|uniref:Uncharacterized protein n=1 Tax=Acanthamoeba castellanii (strain ATCC 30010 / Neff) TaxID=1257118 RepID=L8H685_ACACF|nr:uncharacterized protein ACA1_053840 [Acanthamoeba castellanii str. Neff]ELR20640.1 hypothetical protein ACA1_053840 [Acanthamoeba castellanii str. Neff]